MSTLCIIYNFAQLYRQPIFQKIDQEWDCEWYFGENPTDIKSMDKGILKKEHYVKTFYIHGPFYWQAGIGKLIRKKRFDSYILLGELHCLSTWWFLLQKKLFYRNKKVILWSHGWYGKESSIKNWLKGIFFGMSDLTFTYGEYAKKLAIENGFPKDKLSTIHNSLNHEYQVYLREKLTPSTIYVDHFKNNFKNLIFIGRLTDVKRLDLLLEALSILKNRGKQYNLTLIGDGNERNNLELITKNLSISDSVWFYGECYDDKENAELIFNADLCVSPGNVGLTAMHSMVFGCPVITHDNFPMQMPEFEAIIPNKTGTFFKYNDVLSLSEEITKWFSKDDYSRDRIRINCYNEIDSNWTPEFQIRQLKEIFEHRI